MTERNERPRGNSSRPSSRSGRPSSSRPSRARSERNSSDRSKRPKRDDGRPPRREEQKEGEKRSFSNDSRSPRSHHRKSDRTSDRPRDRRDGEKKFVKKPGFGAPHQPRPRIFEPELLEEITGENLEKSVRAELLSLSADNGAYVSKHLESVHYFSEIDPERAYQHALAAAHHAGRLAVVRETAGYAAYRAGHYEIALRELRAAHRISGDVSAWPVMADCERGLGNPLKALKMAGSPEVKRLEKAEEIEMRIVAAGARRDLNEAEAAVITLQCKELNQSKEPWAVRLRYAYADALDASGRREEARQWFKKAADVDFDEVTDAAERA